MESAGDRERRAVQEAALRILITGRGTSGSWQIRGVQIGAAIAATVLRDATSSEIDAHDLAVMVKRPSSGLIERLRLAGRPWVWDVVDAWPQPYGNAWTKPQCLDWLAAMLRNYRPTAIVAATRRMAEDVGSVGFGGPILALPHHARPGLTPAPPRPAIGAVCYEGSPSYLGRWAETIAGECAARDWRFIVNPTRLSEGDIVIAARHCDGYAARNWKSNVKLANAQGAGLPIIVNREAGYLETASGAECWCDEPSDLGACLEELAPLPERQRRADRMAAAAISLDRVAGIYSNWLRAL